MNSIVKVCLSLFLVSGACGATDIAIGGNVVATPCLVDTGSVSQDVNFGQQRKAGLSTAGAFLDWQPFKVKLVSCPASTTNAIVTFMGTPSTDDGTLFANAGTAPRVAVQMAQDSDRSKIQSNGSSMTVAVDAQRNATYALAGRLISPTGNAGPGSVNTVVQMNFTYQ